MSADPSAEILRQLTRIADAATASHTSSWAEWLKTVASFAAGLLSAYVTDLLRNRSSDRNEQGKMRRIVYYELAHCFIDLHQMIAATGTVATGRFSVFKDLCPFDGERYMKDNPAVFYALPEGQILTWLYYWFHRVDGGGLENPRIYGLVEMKAPLRFFSDCYRKYPSLRKNFKRALLPATYKAIESIADSYRDSATLQEFIDSGIIEIIKRKPESSPGTG